MSARTNGQTVWTEAEMERFIDGDLEAARAEELGARLAADAALAARVAELREADAVMRMAMLTPQPPSARSSLAAGRRFGPMRLALAGLAVASVVIAAGVMLWGWSRGPQEPAPVVTVAEPREREGEGGDLFRVVLAIELPAKDSQREPAPVVHGPQPEEPEGVQRDLRAFHHALASGDSDDARAAFSRLSGKDRRAALGAVISAVRSADAAEAVLDALPPAEQVMIARAWAIEGAGGQRPVAFTRLRELSTDPQAGDSAGVVIRELNARPELAGWIASYGLSVRPSGGT